MPPPTNDVTVNVIDTSWMVVGQTVFVGTAGFFTVESIPGDTIVVLVNTGDNGNAILGTIIVSDQGVSPGGVQGSVLGLNGLSPTTTKGDIIVDNGANHPTASDVRFGVGTTKQVLHVDTGQPQNLRYGNVDLTGATTALTGPLGIALGGTGQATQQAALNSLMPSSPVLGDLAKFNGTNWVRFPITVTSGMRQTLRTNVAGTDDEWAWQGILQSFFGSDFVYNNPTITTGISLTADTAPTNSTGTQLFTQTITPSNTTSHIHIRGVISLTTSSSGAILVICSGSTVIACFANPVVSSLIGMPFDFAFVPGATTPITISLRVGTGGSGSCYLNGNSGGRVLGGALGCSFTVEERA